MKKTPLFLLAFVCAGLFAQGQILDKMKLIEGGTRTLGGGYQYEVDGYTMRYLGKDPQFEQLNAQSVAIGEVPAANNPERIVTVSNFYMAETEVTNSEYRQFLVATVFDAEAQKAFYKAEKMASKGKAEDYNRLMAQMEERAKSQGIFPNTQCWTQDFKQSYNEPLASYYWSHPAFDEYPVVGVSWSQAKAYCEWLTEYTNAALAKKGKPALPEFRLPTEMEWEYAAHGEATEGQHNYFYPWGAFEMAGTHGFGANIKTAPMNYHGDGYEYTAPVKTFKPNGFGLYQMSGNVSEWTEDAFVVNDESSADLAPRILPENYELKRVVKGGSWADYCYAAQIGSRTGFKPDQGTTRVGFRVAMSQH